MLIPVTKMIVGKSTGSLATVVPLVILSAPFFARLVETNLLAVDPGKIEAAQMMGASNRQIRWGVLIREAMPASSSPSRPWRSPSSLLRDGGASVRRLAECHQLWLQPPGRTTS